MVPELLPSSPQLIADDTWLIPTIMAEPSGAFLSVHTMVIRGEQPVIVDTGCSLFRDVWMEKAFSVVDPLDVRWIFITHDDHDHIGNLEPVLEMCPNATLIGNFLTVARLSGDVPLPLHRMRWMDAGDTLDIGDRVLTAVRPPMFDSPSTRAVHDSFTRVLWAADSFASFLPGEVYDAGDVPVDMYDQSFAVLNGWNTPWLEWVDTDRFAAHVNASRALPLDVVASCHGPVHRGHHIDEAYRRTLDLAAQPILPMPGQAMLDQLLSSILPPVVAA